MHLPAGKRIGIVASNHTGYVEEMFSCMETGNIAVPLRSIDDIDRIEAANVDQVIIPARAGTWMRKKFSLSKSDNVAMIAFTSGTEGRPKGVILTQNNLVDVDIRLNLLMQPDESISEYIGVPVYHSFGFGRCRAVALAGGRFYVPDHGFNPSEIGSMLRAGEINAISAVPSLWRVLLANKDLIGSYGRRVRWIEIGSQYMSRQEKEELKVLFPEASIVQHYGLTEASRTTLLEIHKAEGDVLESVGQASGHVEVKLVQEGRIAIRGKHVARGYLINQQEVLLQDDDGWFLTNDLGSLENGYLYYQGRADDVINCGGIKVYPETLEAKIHAHIKVSHGLAVCRKPDAMRGEGFLVAITKDVDLNKQQLRQAVLQATQELGINAANAITIFDVDSLPITATGKVQRKKLTEWYTVQSPVEQIKNINLSELSPIQDIFCKALNLSKLNPQGTFISLGGDSLSYVQLAMQLERHLGYLPQDWEHLSIKQIEQLQPQHQITSMIETDTFLRALAILGVVSNHLELLPKAYNINGGSMLLLIIVGLNFARFKKCAVFNKNFLEAVKSLAGSLIIPYFVISGLYQLKHRSPNFPILLMIDNFFRFEEKNFTYFPFPVWFINVVIQCLIGFILLLSIHPIHKFARLFPWKFGVMLLSISVIVGIGSAAVFHPHEINQFPRLPYVLFWLFILGWCIHFAKSKTEKIVTAVILLASLFTCFAIYSKVTSECIWILIGGTLLLWVPYITIPLAIKPVIQTIAAASYYIYLTHLQMWIYYLRLTKNVPEFNHPLLRTVTVMLAGVLIWSLFQIPRSIKWSRITLKFQSGHSNI